jgi:hypothetical protein
MKKDGETQPTDGDNGQADMSDDSNGDAPPGHYDEDDDDDDDGFAGGFLGRGPSHIAALRALAGAYSGQQSRLRNILEQLRSKDASLQLIALQELSELLLMATEDTLAGNFQPDQYVKELVALLQPSDFGEENPEMMLLACRCLANLMEALPAATANVVYGGAVPVLCSKLLEISFIDLAEQCLSVSLACLRFESKPPNVGVDFGEDICGVSCRHCTRRWSHSLPYVPRLLRDEHPADRRNHSRELLSQYSRRIIPHRPRRYAHPEGHLKQQRPKGCRARLYLRIEDSPQFQASREQIGGTRKPRAAESYSETASAGNNEYDRLQHTHYVPSSSCIYRQG